MSSAPYPGAGLDWAELTRAVESRPGSLFELGQLDAADDSPETRGRIGSLCASLGFHDRGNAPGLGWEQRFIARTLTLGARRANPPMALLAVGQAGSGGDTLMEGLRRSRSESASLDPAEIVCSHPDFARALAAGRTAELDAVDAAARQLAGSILRQLVELGANLALRATFTSAEAALGLLRSLRAAGYRVEILYACTHHERSWRRLQGWPAWRTRAVIGAVTANRATHRAECEAVRDSLERVQAQGIAERIVAIADDGATLALDADSLRACGEHLGQSAPADDLGDGDRPAWRADAKARLRKRARG